MNVMDKGIDRPYLRVYVTCRVHWVSKMLHQIDEFKVGDTGDRGHNAFVQRCNCGPTGVAIHVDPQLAIVLKGRVELWVTKSGPSDPVAGVVLGGVA